MSKKKIVSKSF